MPAVMTAEEQLAYRYATMFLGSHPSIVRGDFQPTIDALARKFLAFGLERQQLVQELASQGGG